MEVNYCHKPLTPVGLEGWGAVGLEGWGAVGLEGVFVGQQQQTKRGA